MVKKKHLLFVLFLLMALLSACAGPVISEEPELAAETLDFTDSDGNSASLSNYPERIIVAGKATPYVLDTIYLFPEAAKKLAAIEVRGFDTHEFLTLVDPQVEVKNVLERDAGPEQIAPHNPDLVLVKNYSMSSLGAAMGEIGVPALGLNLETPELFYKDIQLLGEIFNNSARADQIKTFYQSRVDKIAEDVNALDRGTKPSVLVLQYSEDGGETAFKVPPQNYLQTMMVEMAGGEPVWLNEIGAEENWMVVGLEQIAVWNADMVFIVQYNADSTEAVQKIIQTEGWSSLDAVNNGQVYGYPADYASWDLIDPRWILGLQWMAGKINPELESANHLEQQVFDFYHEMYGLSQEQITQEIYPRLSELGF